MIRVCPLGTSETAARSILNVEPDANAGEEEAVGVELAVGLGVLLAAGRATPLFQTKFLPDLIAVNFFPRQTIICPSLVGFSVGPLAALAGGIPN